MKLFCLPYAGGSSDIFFKLKKELMPEIEVCPIELAGRRSRYSEPLYKSMSDAVNDVYNIISSTIDCDDKYGIFGHSMGSIIAYELCYKILEEQKNMPTHTFFSGCKSPSLKRKDKLLHNLPDDEFKGELWKMGGTPEEVFNNSEILELLMPMIRADFKIAETYEYINREVKLPINISILNGKDDCFNLFEIIDWRNHTSKCCNFKMYDGGHFYIYENTSNIAKFIIKQMFYKE
ncbi:thioesterase II family protein [Clostridium botulinum]|uniref:thioesterase II family protein n=1 Tax=Clostridium botulinum TaxID=1491 RepID=UPI003DA2EC8A